MLLNKTLQKYQHNNTFRLEICKELHKHMSFLLNECKYNALMKMCFNMYVKHVIRKKFFSVKTEQLYVLPSHNGIWPR